MLFSQSKNYSAVRSATTDSLESYVAGAVIQPSFISQQAALEEAFFLGLRLNRGLYLSDAVQEFGEQSIKLLTPTITDLVENGLLEQTKNSIRLTPRGRLLSNEVFQRFIATTVYAPPIPLVI
jgi:oxygen-independent coproporphyrinogen-3 oxidase